MSLRKLKRSRSKKSQRQLVSKHGTVDPGKLLQVAQQHLRAGDVREAEQVFKQIITAFPGNAAACNDLGVLYHSQGKIDAAVAFYRKALAIDRNYLQAHINLGRALHQQGRLDEAAAFFEAALRVNSCQPDLWKNLGRIYSEQGKFDKALFAYENGARIRPDDFDTLTKIGILQQKQGDLDQAIVFFKKALEINPEFIGARFSLVEALEVYNKVEEAYTEALKGLETAPTDISLLSITAACERRLGELQKALDRLGGLNVLDAGLSEQRQYFFELGRVCDRAGEYDRAYDAFVSGNRASREINSRIDKNYFLSRIGILRRQFSNRAALPEVDPSLSGNSPVFLVGFPRSGTTLLDQVLDSHVKVRTMEEKDIIFSLEKEFVDSFEEYLPAWQALTPGKIKELQCDYYHKADTYLERRPGNILIDRMPLNIMRTALIWRIFPDAKFILAIRHPLDVCLSCFMQDFSINTANANFFCLEDGATFYGEVMALWQLYVDILPLNCHMVRYEDLVAGLETEARRLFDFIGIEWDEKALKFHEHAKEKGRIKTASYHQVTQAIYQHARYRWQRYEKYCEPLKEKLASFIDYFGY